VSSVLTVTSVATSTLTANSSSTGVSPGAVGGIVAGIVVGFLILDAVAFFYIIRGYRKSTLQGPGEQEIDGGMAMREQNIGGRKDGDAVEQVGGRTSAFE
jgi:hypothetical protein